MAQSGMPMPKPAFQTPFLYKWVRHPMQLGVIMALFSTPQMTAGDLLFVVSMTCYTFVGLYFEERSLVRRFGDRYRQYQSDVPMLLPRVRVGRPRRAV
jgi:protein-S-isoprenylcysteine O-methyltransferase Ste14